MELKHIRKEEALRYLGYRNNKPDENVLEILDETEKELLKAVRPKLVYKIYDVLSADTEKGEVKLKNTDLTFKGFDIAKHLSGCERAVVMACTASGEVDRLLRIYQIKDITCALVADSLASAAIEQICDMAQEEIMNKTDGFCTWRFSCGYGDFPLESQKDIIKALDAEKRIGLYVTESCMLVPTKSVTAVFGISESFIKKTRL